jgi:hypothetical protein
LPAENKLSLTRIILLPSGISKKKGKKRNRKMEHYREETTSKPRYYTNNAINGCALCGSGAGAVFFKGRLICEECLDIVKELY